MRSRTALRLARDAGGSRAPGGIRLPGVDELITLGVKAYARGDLEESARLWRGALELDPGNERVRTYLEQLGSARVADDWTLPRLDLLDDEPPPDGASPPGPSSPSTANGAPTADVPAGQTAPEPEQPELPGSRRFSVPPDAFPAPHRVVTHRTLRMLAAAAGLAVLVGLAAWGLHAALRRDNPSLSRARDAVAAAWARVSALSEGVAERATEKLRGASHEKPVPAPAATQPPRPPGKPSRPATTAAASSPAQASSGTVAAVARPFDGSPASVLPGARWGMSVDEVASRLPGASLVSLPVPSTVPGLLLRARAGTVQLAGLRCSTDLLFDDGGRLRGILLGARIAGGARDAFGEVASYLRTALGDPGEEERGAAGTGPWRARARWTVPSGSVDLEGGEGQPDATHVLAVDVRDGGVEPVREGQVSVVLLARTSPVLAPEP